MPEDVIDRDVRPRMPRFQQLLWVPWTVLLAVGTVLVILDDEPGPRPWIMVGLALTSWVLITSTRLPRRVVVDGAGVKLPFKRVLPWSEVASVKKPGPFTGTVTLRRRDGTETYTGLPVEDSEAVARIGDVPLQ